MANRITEEQKLEINKLYYEIGVKSRVAKLMGISAASVSKYIIPGWKPEEEREIEKFDGEVPGPDEFINGFLAAENKQDYFWNARLLSEDEWTELEEMQKEEIFI